MTRLTQTKGSVCPKLALEATSHLMPLPGPRADAESTSISERSPKSGPVCSGLFAKEDVGGTDSAVVRRSGCVGDDEP